MNNEYKGNEQLDISHYYLVYTPELVLGIQLPRKGFPCEPRSDNSGRSRSCTFDDISETILNRVSCNVPNERAYFSLSSHINDTWIGLDFFTFIFFTSIFGLLKVLPEKSGLHYNFGLSSDFMSKTGNLSFFENGFSRFHVMRTRPLKKKTI